MADALVGSGPRALPPPRVRRLVDRVPFLDKELFVLGDLVPPGGTVVDVGAAGGAHAFAAARLVGPGGRVVAVEARAGSARLLRTWRLLLGADQVTVVHGALGAHPGILRLRVPLVPTRSHAAGGDDGTLLARLPARRRWVPMTTLDQVVATHGLGRVDLVKVDVEGGEAEVLAGAERTLAESRPALVLEVHDPFLRRAGTTAEALFARVVARGYGGHRLGDDGLVPVSAPRRGEHNYVFLPSG